MNLLILDDHPLYAEALRQTALRLGSQVFIDMAGSSQEAIEFFDAGKVYELLLVDIDLPGLDGFGFIRLLRERMIAAPVLVVSASDDESLCIRAIEQGAMGFVHKSTNNRGILRAIRRVLSGERYIPENISLVCPEESLEFVSKKLNQLGISRRQYEILQQIEKGQSNKAIANQLHITESTVKTHVSGLMGALGAKNRTACVVEGLRLGLLS